jgi:hypothetical protein
MVGESSGDIDIDMGDAGGEGGKGIDAGSCDKSHGGLALGEVGMTAGVWLGWLSINQGGVEETSYCRHHNTKYEKTIK